MEKLFLDLFHRSISASYLILAVSVSYTHLTLPTIYSV